MKEKGDKMGNSISFDEVYKDVEERISKTISELEKKYGFRIAELTYERPVIYTPENIHRGEALVNIILR